MYIKDVIEKYKDKKIKIYVDMDGVIADYDVGNPGNYDKKRPLLANIKLLEEIAREPNIEMYILSVSRMNEGVEQKEYWLDQYAPFFEKDKRVIIPREKNGFLPATDLKVNFIKKIERNGEVIIVIDDDPRILHALAEANLDMCLLKDTALIL